MKRYILSIIFIMCFSLHLAVYSQDIKQKAFSEAAPPVTIELDSSNILRVRNAPIGKKLEIYSIVGPKVAVIEMKSSSGDYPLNLPKSIYVIKLGETVKKVVAK